MNQVVSAILPEVFRSFTMLLQANFGRVTSYRLQTSPISLHAHHNYLTERCGQVGSTPASYSESPGFRSLSGDQLCWPKLYWFSQFLRANARMVIRPRPLTSISFSVRYLLIIMSFNGIRSELLTASLSKPQMSVPILFNASLYLWYLVKRA
jgi:hypothetical protein